VPNHPDVGEGHIDLDYEAGRGWKEKNFLQHWRNNLCRLFEAEITNDNSSDIPQKLRLKFEQ
jgi:hypothetical protein